MRTTKVAVLLLLLGFAAAAPAGDDKPPAGKKENLRVYSEEEWIEKLKDIQKVDLVGFKREKVLAYEANKAIVRVRVKIWDIRPSANGPTIDIVDIIPRRSVPDSERISREPIVIPAVDGDAIKEWKRWDRLAFKVKPKVTPDGFVQYERHVNGVVDIDRTPNPGVEYAPQEQQLAGLDSFDDFCARYARAVGEPDWKAAWRQYHGARSKLFPVTARVQRGAVDAQGRAPRGPSSIVFDFAKPPGVTGFGHCDGRGHPQMTASVVVDDPQLVEKLTPGAPAELLLQIVGLERASDLEVRQGKFRVEVSFGKAK
jgi:hypothetical protein